MRLEMAPLEGLTTYIFRNAYAKYFGHVDKYYTPFLSLHKEKEFNHKELQEEYKRTLLAFHDELYHSYQQILGGDRNVLFKMKELWSYLICSFPEKEKQMRKLHKLKTCADYESWIRMIS